MNSTYAQKSSTVQKAAAPNAASVLDLSAQNESLQRKADMANNAAQRAEAPRPNNTGMPDNLKSGIESLSGFSMDDVRVHYNSSKPATVQALAYTQGTDIHVAPGQEKCLPHEAWHVAQQMAGRVSPTTNVNGMPVNDNAALEHEADVMGEKAVQCKMVGVSFANGEVQNTAVQRMAYAKPNEDGSVSAETEQYEGNDDLARMFGRTDKDENGRYKRPDNVAKKVDQYKKEMLTYIANLIENDTKSKNGGKSPYGAHISVAITRGIWFISINSDATNSNTIQQLHDSSRFAKEHIIERSFALCTKIENDIKGLNDDERKKFGKGLDEESVKKQALYIAYRWAAKKTQIVVKQNKPEISGVVHGEMRTIDFLQNAFVEESPRAQNLILEINNDLKNEKINVPENLKESLQEKALEKKITLTVSPLSFTFDKEADWLTVIDILNKMIDKFSEMTEKYKKDKNFQKKKQALKKILMKAESACACNGIARLLNQADEKRNKNRLFSLEENGVLLNRVIRVGGTLTACHDCAYEIGLHNKPNPEGMNGLDVHNQYGNHLASEIGGRRTVTMTSNSGAVFNHWKFKGKSRQGLDKSSYDSEKYHLAHDGEQKQDYNELYDSFNSMDLKTKDGKKSVRMIITNSIRDVWEERKSKAEKDKIIGENVKENFDDCDKKEMFILKNKIANCLEKIYAIGKIPSLNKDNFNEDEINEKKNALKSCLMDENLNFLNIEIQDCIDGVFKSNDAFNKKMWSIVKFGRSLINYLDVKIQSTFVLESLLKESEKEMLTNFADKKNDLLKTLQGQLDVLCSLGKIEKCNNISDAKDKMSDIRLNMKKIKIDYLPSSCCPKFINEKICEFFRMKKCIPLSSIRQNKERYMLNDINFRIDKFNEFVDSIKNFDQAVILFFTGKIFNFRKFQIA